MHDPTINIDITAPSGLTNQFQTQIRAFNIAQNEQMVIQLAENPKEAEVSMGSYTKRTVMGEDKTDEKTAEDKSQDKS